ncbi:MAG: O-antigen ligase family protein [Candidatus Glassbacteria bacterium]|nr:O-antigen ligase family protein [Candidatus Glassbacteria bacterium]
MSETLRKAWLVYVCLLPFNLFYFLGIQHIYPVDLVFPVVLVLSAAVVYRRLSVVLRQDLPVLAYLGIFLVIASAAVLRSGFSGSLATAVAAQVMLVALYLLFRCGVAERLSLARLLTVWAAASTAACLVGLGAVALGICGVGTPLARWYPNLGPGAWRLIGTVGHSPNNAYGYFHLGFFISLGLWLGKRDEAGPGGIFLSRRVLLAAVLVHAAALLLTFSRGLTGLLLGLIVAAPALAGKRHLRHLLPVKITLWAVLILLFAYSAVFFTYTTDALFTPSRQAADSLRLDKEREHLRVYSYKNVLHLDEQARYRRLACGFTWLPSMHGYLLEASLHVFLGHWALGVGPGRFPEVLARLRDSGELGLPPGLPALRPHSTFMGALAEGGLAGFAGLAVLFWFLLGPRSRRRLTEDPLGTCLYACLAGYLLFGLNVDVMNFRWLWLLMAAAAAWSKPDV